MPASTLARLQSLYPSLTDAEQRVASTIIGRLPLLRTWSGHESARHNNTAESAVFRLANKLGFAAFKELKLSVLDDEVAQRTR